MKDSKLSKNRQIQVTLLVIENPGFLIQFDNNDIQWLRDCDTLD